MENENSKKDIKDETCAFGVIRLFFLGVRGGLAIGICALLFMKLLHFCNSFVSNDYSLPDYCSESQKLLYERLTDYKIMLVGSNSLFIAYFIFIQILFILFEFLVYFRRLETSSTQLSRFLFIFGYLFSTLMNIFPFWLSSPTFIIFEDELCQEMPDGYSEKTLKAFVTDNIIVFFCLIAYALVGLLGVGVSCFGKKEEDLESGFICFGWVTIIVSSILFIYCMFRLISESLFPAIFDFPLTLYYLLIGNIVLLLINCLFNLFRFWAIRRSKQVKVAPIKEGGTGPSGDIEDMGSIKSDEVHGGIGDIRLGQSMDMESQETPAEVIVYRRASTNIGIKRNPILPPKPNFFRKGKNPKRRIIIEEDAEREASLPEEKLEESKILADL